MCKKGKKCSKCEAKMILIKGDWGKLLKEPYWKCMKCGNEIKEKINYNVYKNKKANKECIF